MTPRSKAQTATSSGDANDPNLAADLHRLSSVLVPFGVAGTLGALFYAVGAHEFLPAVGAVLLCASAAAVVGALIGLLFGIPRLLSQTGAGRTTSNGSDQGGAAGRASVSGDGTGTSELRYGGNSNLEQVSDWLTKVLIGATLAQFRDICAWIGQIARWCASGLDKPHTAAFAGAILVFFGVWGFLVSYLLTRRVLPAMVLRGDLGGRAPSATLAAATLAVKEAAAAGPGGPVVGPELKRLASEVIAAPSANVSAADRGRAQLLQGHWRSAANSLADAVDRTPDDAALVEDLMFSALYVRAPDGFRRALDAGEQAPVKTPRMWVYLAAALGQQHAWEREHQADATRLRAIRDRALEAVRRALAMNPSQKDLLASLLNPQPGSTDDDLKEFRDDKDFRDLLLPH